MANDLIPEPNIQATNIPTGGAPQVSFAPWATPKNTFASLSKTIGAAAQTMVNFNDLEDREADSQKAWKEQLEQIHGLTKTGQLSQADYMKIQREANGKAQKDGIIRAHENWSTMTAVSKERSRMRVDALTSHMESQGGLERMSNPDPDSASTFGQEQAKAFGELAEVAIGKDSQGNEVFMDAEGMSPMELVAFSQGQSALETATNLAVEERKHKQSIEASTLRMEADVMRSLEGIAKLPSDRRDELAPMYLGEIQSIIGAAHGAGVTDINNHVLQSLTSFGNQMLAVADPTDEDAMVEANAIFDMIEEQLMLRDGVRFAEDGTGNYNKVETIRNSMVSSFDTAHAAYKKNLPKAEDDFEMRFENELTDWDRTKESDAAFRLRMRKLAISPPDQGGYGVPFQGYEARVTSFEKGQTVDTIIDATFVRDTYLKVRTGIMSPSNYESILVDLKKLAASNQITKEEFDAKLGQLQTRYDSYDDEQKSTAEAILNDGIGRFDENTINTEIEQLLARFHGVPWDTGSLITIPDAVNLSTSNRMAQRLQDAVIRGGAFEGIPQTRLDDIKEKMGFARLDDAVKVSIANDIQLLATGIPNMATLTAEQRSEAAAMYLRAFMKVQTARQVSDQLQNEALGAETQTSFFLGSDDTTTTNK